ncbi:uncharacterized protein LOC113210536 [Frankliniella occidentalis]|uniref:DNA-directed DNA polymerase n=1 Tax=Frankliniella occidentalis TaxID=133901 RepID=A0A6J1SYE2_FRAOC|nr:uncharacterized protein LOC113210536 [Frankliniella occidentalis]
MDIIWIRPAIKPVHPSEVEDLSDSALKLLRALELRFHQRHTGIFQRLSQANPYDQPRPMGPQLQTCSLSPVRFNSFSREVPSITPWSGGFNITPAAAQNDRFNHTDRSPPHAPYYTNMGSPLPKSQTCSKNLWNPSSPAHSRTGRESTWEELSDIFEEGNDDTLRRQSESFSTAVSPRIVNPSLLHSKSSSPMSVLNMSLTEQSSFLQTRSWPDPPLKRDEVIRLTKERRGAESIPKRDETCYVHTFSANNDITESGAKSNDEDGNSLYESFENRSFGSNDNHSVNLVQQKDLRTLSSNKFSPQKLDFQCSDYKSDTRFKENTELQSASSAAPNLLDRSHSSPLFDRSFSFEGELTQPIAHPSGNNDAAYSLTLPNYICSPDLFQDEGLSKHGSENKTNLNHSEEDERISKHHSEDRENLEHSTESILITPDKKVKKFLGNTFKRAIRSSCLSRMGSSEESFTLNREPQSEDVEREQPTLTLNEEENTDIETSLNTVVREENAQNVWNLPTIEGKPHQNQNTLHHLSETTMLKEKISKDPESTLFFPIFNTTNQTKRKHDAREETSMTGSQGSCRKKIKFTVPYKKQDSTGPVSTAKTIQELATKLSKQVGEKFEFEELTENLANEITQKITNNVSSLQEISITLLYKEGFCQLNRSKDCKTSHPDKVLLRFVWECDIQYISLSLLKTAWSSAFLKNLMSDKTRKICFEAQEIIQLFVDKFGLNATEVASQWLILDPLVGCWLLNSDEPPHSFKDVLNFLQLCEDSNGAVKLLCKLSQCAQVLYEKLTRFGLWKLFLHIEMRVTPILACMELHGIKVDKDKLRKMASLLKGRLEDIQKAAYKAAGRPFQLTSPQQLSTILYEDLKLDLKHNISVKETNKQHKSTSEAMLNKFKNLHPLPGIVLEFRGLHKLKSTYVDAVLGHLSGDSIFTTWDQISAATGRITSNEPNLQAIPKQPLMPDLDLRTAFVARDGFSFLAADFQHIELRVFAHLSTDAALISALSQKTDVFKILSKEWLQIADVDKVTVEDRDKTKRIVYALMYGAGPSKLTEFLHIDYNHASKILEKFSDAFPKMQDFTKNTIDLCRKQGYLATASGRRRSFPNIKSENFHLRTHSERQAVNFLIQGMAADLCKCAMVHTQRHLASVRVSQLHTTRLLLQIHDELLWEVPDSDLLHITDVLQEAMEGATLAVQSLSSFSVPLPVVMKTGKTWGEMHIAKTALLGPSQQQQP